MLLEEFGVNYKRCPQLDDDIAAMIDNSETYRFDNMQDFKNQIAQGRNSGGHLVRRFVMKSHPRPYPIKMTGSRSDEANNANATEKLTKTPSGYRFIYFNPNSQISTSFD